MNDFYECDGGLIDLMKVDAISSILTDQGIPVVHKVEVLVSGTWVLALEDEDLDRIRRRRENLIYLYKHTVLWTEEER